MLNGQGIFARCLITWPPSLAGQRFYQPVDLTQDISLKRYTQRITDLLQRTTSASKAADNLLRIAGVLAVLEDRDLIEVTHILSAKRSAARRIHTRGRSESGKSKITLQESTMRTL